MRKKLSMRANKRIFRKSASRVNKANTGISLMRGGMRK